MYAVYSNPGQLDIRALTIMGVSAKPATSSPIGYFGTGLKYAAAIAMRHNLHMRINDGTGKVWTVSHEPTNFRGKEFLTCFVESAAGDRIQLPFTTEYGKDWKLWELHRELECNARDEGGHFFLHSTEKLTVPVLDVVEIVLSGDALIETIQNERDSIFFDRQRGPQLLRRADFELKPDGDRHLYYRGMRAMSAPAGKRFHFTWNIIEKQKLTENRTLESTYAVGNTMKEILQSKDISFAQALIKSPDAYEWDLIGTWIYELPTELLSWTRAWATNHKIPAVIEQQLWHQLAERDKERAAEANSTQAELINKAVDFLKSFGYKVDEYPIRIARSLPHNVLALAESNRGEDTIILSERLLKLGLDRIITVLLEEYVHLDRKLSDESREMQTFLFEELVFQMQVAQRLAKDANFNHIINEMRQSK